MTSHIFWEDTQEGLSSGSRGRVGSSGPLFGWAGGAGKEAETQQPPCQSENLGRLVSKARNSDSRSCGCPVTVLCGSPLQEVTRSLWSMTPREQRHEAALCSKQLKPNPFPSFLRPEEEWAG